MNCPRCNEMLYPVNGKGGESIPPQGDRIGYCIVCGELWKIPREVLDYPRKDRLNDILVECAKLRGCYPLVHRTLRQFNWFCRAVIFGGNNEENRLKERFNKQYYDYGDGLELIRLGEAFLVYCRGRYGPIQVFSPDFNDVTESGEKNECWRINRKTQGSQPRSGSVRMELRA